MRRTFFALLVFAFIFSLNSEAKAQAQGQPAMDSLSMSFWPEYDRTSMLVIYRFNLTADTPLPSNLTLRIPASAGEPWAVAVGPQTGQEGDVPYTREVNGEWADISFVATMPFVQFEYYDPSLTKDGTTRHYAFQWDGRYAVNNMTIEVQQPADASNMTITPDLGSPFTDDATNLVYYRSTLPPLAAGQAFNLAVNYQKSSDQLTVTTLPVEPSQPLSTSTAGRFRLSDVFPWAAGFLGLALIIGGIFWYSHLSKVEAAEPRRSKRRRSSPTQPVVEESDIYCHQCGKRAAVGDRFCRSCGTKLRAVEHI